ncbi:hypothetical protein [Steroidobacter sp.]|uniref:hypothetical protein n=1 Tax=Steroidobacter sp. TaxID=1978227 RepID=UPI001A3CD87C|nr:hypothetical protein [Steroidobacter sp.]MBL8268079.1 hypothetical protein [Steroidobacter sp.]
MSAAAAMMVSPAAEKLFQENSDRARYARCIKASKRVRWDIDADVFRGRAFDFRRKFLPDALTKVNDLAFLTPDEKRSMSHVQGRSYACLFGLVERFISAKTLELASKQGLGDQVALEGLVRFSDEELKHQELFRRIESAISARMPGGFALIADANEVARQVLNKSSWAVLALTCHIELFTQAHYRESIERDDELSDLYRDVFRFHWLEECQHAVMDEIEWAREDRGLSVAERDIAVDDFIALLRLLDEVVCTQSSADAGYFMRLCDRTFSPAEQQQIRETMMRAYRWQYIVSGAQHPQMMKMMSGMVTRQQLQRVQAALAPILASRG